MSTKEERIEIVNKIITEIANRGRNFFKNKSENKTAYIFIKKKRLFMMSEDNAEWQKPEIYLHSKHGNPPRNFHNGGTLWGLTKDFKEFIIKGGYTNHNNGYGGLYCSHWGYPEEDMTAIQKLAVELGYLEEKPNNL